MSSFEGENDDQPVDGGVAAEVEGNNDEGRSGTPVPGELEKQDSHSPLIDPAEEAEVRNDDEPAAASAEEETAKPEGEEAENPEKPVPKAKAKATPKAKAKSTPKAKAKSTSKAKTTTPKAKTTTPKAKTTTPKATSTTPAAKATAPKAKATAPKAKATAPKTAAAAKPETKEPTVTARETTTTKQPATSTKDPEIQWATKDEAGFFQRLPKDSAYRFFLWSSWGFIGAALALLAFGIVWIAVTKGTTFGAYSPLVLVAAAVMAFMAVLDIVFLCKSPNQVFCHGVMAIITFFVFVALVGLAIVLGGFQFFTIRLEDAVFRLDFDYYDEHLNLNGDTAKIKAVDDGYFWMVFAFGIVTAVIIIAVFVISTISCCRYLRCHYFVPLFCGFMPMLVGVMGMVFAFSLAMLSAMTRQRYSFIYNRQGWWIFFMGLADLLLSFLLLGVFFCVTCRSDRNPIQRDATYPEKDGFDSIKSRSRVMGKDYWQCRFEFCLFMWLNVVVCTPVFVFILVQVVVTGVPDHSYPLPCIDFQSKVGTSSLSTSPANSFAALLGAPSYDEDCDPLSGKNFETNATCSGNSGWDSFKGKCNELVNSARDFMVGRDMLKDDMICGSFRSRRSNSGRKSVLYGVSEFAQKLVAYFGYTTDRVHASSKTEAVTETETQGASETPFTSFTSLDLIDMLMTQNPDQSEVRQEEKLEKEEEGKAAVVEDTTADIIIIDSFSRNNTSTHNVLGSASALTLAPSAAASSVSNAEVCYDFEETIYEWKEEIESMGAEMCLITGIAMLVPALPILGLDALVGAILFAIFFAIMGWIGCLMYYYIFYCIVKWLCTHEVVDDVREEGGYIVTYYHIEDHSPGFNLCICCGMNGCCVFIQAFSACVIGLVLAFFLSEKVCGCCEDEPTDDEDEDTKKPAADGDGDGTSSAPTDDSANAEYNNTAVDPDAKPVYADSNYELGVAEQPTYTGSDV